MNITPEQIPDEVVKAALEAIRAEELRALGGYKTPDNGARRNAVRHALAAALPVLLGEPVAWMDPASRDVVTAERKHEWMTYFGAGGKVKAESYMHPLYTPPHPGPAQMTTPDQIALPELPNSFGEHCVDDSVRTMREPGYTADQMRATGQACVDALTPAPQVPEWMVLVPREATDEMMDAWNRTGPGWEDAYAAMLSAAPSAKDAEER